MKILIKLKESCKHKRITSGVGTLIKGVIHSIDSKRFDSSIMEKIQEEEEPEEPVEEPEEPVEEPEEPVEPIEEVVEDPAEKALFKLNKAEQTKILKDLGQEIVPRLEKDRVALILELQK